MTTYYNHPHMTAVPTRLLLDTNLSAEAKLTGALLYTFKDGGLSAQELVNVLSLPPEKVAPVLLNSPAMAIWKFWKKTVHSGCT